MTLWHRIRSWWNRPAHLRWGNRGERAAKRLLKKSGLRFLTANFKTKRGEIDLIFRDADVLIFVEVKTRSSEEWTRPAAAVNQEKRRKIVLAALEYLRKIKNPRVKLRFDIVEVLHEEGTVLEVRHLPNTFHFMPPYRYG
jgi:putative endonuclease